MKKWLLTLLKVMVVCTVILVSLPICFHRNIEQLADREINRRIDGHVSFSDLNISLLRNFPNITVSIRDLKVVSRKLAADTLFKVDEVDLILDTYDYVIQGHIDLIDIAVHHPFMDAHISYDGTANFAILKSDADSTATDDVTLHLNHVEIEDADLYYHDEYHRTYLSFRGLSFEGSGEFSDTAFDLDIDAQAADVSVVAASKHYFSDKKLKTSFLFHVDREQQMAYIRESEILINDFPVEMKGTVSATPNRYRFDLAFDSPRSRVQDLLSLVTVLQHDLGNVEAEGRMSFQGFVKGDYVPGTDSIPTFAVGLEVTEGAFKIDTLEDTIRDIHVDVTLRNLTGHIDSTRIELDSIFFRVEDDVVQGHAHIRHLEHTQVDAALQGSLRIHELLDVYPIPHLSAEGDIDFSFKAKGIYVPGREGAMPHLDFRLDLANGKLKYDTLRDSLSQVHFHLEGHTPQGNWQAGRLQVERLHMLLGDDPIEGKAIIENFLTPDIHASLQGKLHLDEIKHLFPLDSMDIRGQLQASVQVDGRYDPAQGRWPQLHAVFSLTDGYYKIPAHHEPLEQLNVMATLDNRGSQPESMVLTLHHFNFRIAEETFAVSGYVRDFKNYQYDLDIQGDLDLDKLTRLYPIPDWSLHGHLTCDVELAGRLADLSTGRYARTQANGFVVMDNVEVAGKILPLPLHIEQAKLRITPEVLYLESMRLHTGRTSLQLDGQLRNYFSFYQQDEGLVNAKFNLRADTLDLNAWHTAFREIDRAPVSVDAGTTHTYSAWQVPRNIDFTLDTDVDYIHYDDMTISNMVGEVLLHDGVLSLRETGFNSLNARFNASGTYDSRDLQHPLFDFKLKVDELDIQRAYREMKLVRELLPAAADAAGRFSIDYNLRGELDSTMYPRTHTLVGGGDMHIAEAKINGMKVFERLSKAARKKEISDPHLKDFTMTTEIRDNKIFVKPFHVKVSGFNTEIEGVNDLSGAVNYVIKVQLLPLEVLRIPFNVSGTYDNPRVTLGKGHQLPESQHP